MCSPVNANRCFTSMRCSSDSVCHSTAISEFLQVGGDGGVQFRSLGLLLAYRRGEPLHLLRERLPVVLDRFRANVATRSEHAAMLCDLREWHALAEPRDVGVRGRTLVAAP